MPSSDPTIPQALASKIHSSQFICGSDECGFGSWAGPVVACAAVTPRDWSLPGVSDSKKLTTKKREALYPELTKLPHGIAEVSPEDIDAMGMSAAWEKAHSTAIQKALDAFQELQGTQEVLVVIDGVRGVLGSEVCPKGDLLIPAISAASIIGKVYRDRLMCQLHEKYPAYAFNSHMGYGTKKHAAALAEHGVTDIHRKSYRPIQELLGETRNPKRAKETSRDIMDLIASMELDE